MLVDPKGRSHKGRYSIVEDARTYLIQAVGTEKFEKTWNEFTWGNDIDDLSGAAINQGEFHLE